MSAAVTEVVVILNSLANQCASYALAPIAVLPGWFSATLVALLTGVAMLVGFKYTSHQRSIKRVRDDIKANLLALSLFQDSTVVSLRSQGRILAGAGRLLLLAIVPILVMTLPACLLLAQLALWYQARPLRVGEETVLTVRLADDSVELPAARLEPTPAIEVTIGPVRVPSKHWICWSVRAQEEGYHHLCVDVAGQQVEKELAVGDRFMRVSTRRPARHWRDVLWHPREAPLPHDSVVQAVEIDYPDRAGWASGSGSWLLYWFAASCMAAFCMRPWLKVHF